LKNFKSRSKKISSRRVQQEPHPRLPNL